MRALLPLLVIIVGCVGGGHQTLGVAVLRVGTGYEITEPSPLTSDGLGVTVQELVFRGLFRSDPNAECRVTWPRVGPFRPAASD